MAIFVPGGALRVRSFWQEPRGVWSYTEAPASAGVMNSGLDTDPVQELSQVTFIFVGVRSIEILTGMKTTAVTSAALSRHETRRFVGGSAQEKAASQHTRAQTHGGWRYDRPSANERNDPQCEQDNVARWNMNGSKGAILLGQNPGLSTRGLAKARPLA